MGKKRKNTTDDSPYTKRTRPSYFKGEEGDDSGPPNTQPRVDPTYGQRGAFPGLDDHGDELFYGPASDGLEYLKIVRSEARGVPNLLVAPRSTESEQDAAIYDNGLGDSRGYYADGAYTAAPTLGPSLPFPGATGAEHDRQDPQHVYCTRLRLRFSLLRATLRCTPPAAAIAALDDDHPITLPIGSKHAFATWRRLLRSTDPIPAQLASLDQASVLRLITMVTANLKRGRVLGRRCGAWVWGLLGRVREVGECGSEEVGVLRDLGKRAVWVLKGWREGVEDEGESVGDADEGHEGKYEEGDVEESRGDVAEEYEDGDAQNRAAVRFLEQEVPRPGNLDAESHVEDAHSHMPDGAQAPFLPDNAPNGISATIQAPTEGAHMIRSEYAQPRTEARPSEGDKEDALAAAKARLTARLAANVDGAGSQEQEMPDDDDVTFATLDMILTVIGEFYGQRDLLEFRDLWDEVL